MRGRARPWIRREVDARVVDELARKLAVSRVTATVLAARGHAEPARAQTHLSASPSGLHDPAALPGMRAAVERLARAVRDREPILVHGDYDVDGVTGTALLVRLLRLVGANAHWHIPNRLVDGYSFGPHSIEKARETGARVVISVDNGTSAFDTIAELASLGVDVIVTDHHEPPLAHPVHGALPPALAIVNPKLAGSTYPWRELCGGAVAFKLAWGLCQELSGAQRVRPELKAFLEDAMALVAIATVCDVVPMRDENRVFARQGLKFLGATRHPGLRALLDVVGVSGRPLTSDDLGFAIGPRINASGRLGSASRAVELLLADDPAVARKLAGELDKLNAKRKEIEQEVLAQAREKARAFADAREWPVLVVDGIGWHPGVVGIVAARLVEEHGRPAFVLGVEPSSSGVAANGASGSHAAAGASGLVAKGSGRTWGAFDLLACLRAGQPLLVRGGGHAQAVGLEVDSAHIPALRDALCAHAREVLNGAAHAPSALHVDCDVTAAHIDEPLLRDLERLEPWGTGNEIPVLASSQLELADEPRVLGADQSHLSLKVRHGNRFLRAMAFGMGSRREEFAGARKLELAFTPRWNTFRGNTSLELLVHDFRAS
ncbi:MAG: single-stranded-DNA-specific exonuclease RecJ [Planctomycetota bacterium]|nr:MAG: single-stranded-DNA-specific exonuclease RecJ [Planctomycetota bacterium]